MSKMKFELNRSGVAELMKSANMQKVIKQHATNIKNRAGSGYEQDLHVGKNRVNAKVWPHSRQAQKDNLNNNTLLKSVKK